MPSPNAFSTKWKANSHFTYIYKSKAGDRSQGQPEGFLFNSFNSEMKGRPLLFSLDCSTLPLMRTLYCWVLSKDVSSTVFKVFGMTRPGIELRSLWPLANTLPTIYIYIYIYIYIFANPSAQTGWDTRTIFNQSLTGLKFKAFLFLDLLLNQGSRTQSALLLTRSWRKNNWIHTFPEWYFYEMQSASSRIWTRINGSISYDNNHYTTGTFYIFISLGNAWTLLSLWLWVK